MAKAIKQKAVESATTETINPPKASVKEAKVATPVSGVVEAPKLSAEDEATLKRLLAIQKQSSTISRSRFTSINRLQGEPESYNRLPPQAKMILEAMDRTKSKKMGVNELVAEMKKTWPTDRYRQDPARIIQFYRQRLEDGKHAKFE